jgi:glucosamine--fructose-6-phosphate aminotransferase (isomerizing)
MCGIVGAIGKRDISRILIEALKRLEYRGYDSAGIAVLDEKQKIKRLRTVGKVHALDTAMMNAQLSGQIGIIHTRWATHGKPCEENAHPHTSGEVALVHNGIIENYQVLRSQLIADGYTFQSETDTEVVVHLLNQNLHTQPDFLAAVRQTIQVLEGAFALVFMSSQTPDQLIAVRRGSPLILGLGVGEQFIASDHISLLPFTQQFIFLEEGDIAQVVLEKIQIFNEEGALVEREIHNINSQQDVIDRGKYRHYMEKEIFEQKTAVNNTLEGRLGKTQILEACFGPDSAEIFDRIEQVQIVACGTSHHAGMIGRYWLEALAGIPCQVEIASEMRYRQQAIQKNTLVVGISQSGETADTLAAIHAAKSKGYYATLAICNVPQSSLVRQADLSFMTRAGIEIGVASTKAFTTQLVALLLLTGLLGRRHKMSSAQEEKLVDLLKNISNHIDRALLLNEQIKKLASHFADKEHALFLGRGMQYPVALEGALKMKEISYIHAEGYPAGELKHGPLALVDKHMPVIAVAPQDGFLEKLQSNLAEVHARGGELFVFVDEKMHFEERSGTHFIPMPTVDPIIAPIIYTIPLQLLAYHVAILKGTDVDQPRNLAKSVTVE